VLFGAGQAFGQAVGVVASEDVGTKGKLRLFGFGGNISVYDSTGITGPAESYSNQLSFFFSPTWHIGKALLKDTWFNKMSMGARLVVSGELSGNDPSFRGQLYSSTSLFTPGAGGLPDDLNPGFNGVVRGAPANQINGTERIWTVSDLWYNVDLPSVYKIPVLGVGISANLRAVIPTSQLSRNNGLLFGLSPSLSLSRAWFKGKFSVAYIARFTKFWFDSAYPKYNAISDTVNVNGRQETTYQPSTTGAVNREWSVWNALNVNYNPTDKLSISALFLLIHTFGYPNSTNCTVPGVPTANLCTDGQAVGDVVGPGQRVQVDSSWFQFSVGYDVLPWLNLGVGLSTFQNVRNNGLGFANPFLRTTPTVNATTIYAGPSINFETLYSSLVK
jgi:hypothetical protein